MTFTWDKAKAKSNLAKHGVSFDDAKRAFADLYAIEYYDDRQDYKEERVILLGMVDGEVLSIVYTERDESISLISAKGAAKNEKKNYFEQNRYSAADDGPRH